MRPKPRCPNFDESASTIFCDEDIDVIITDDGIPEQMVTIVEEAGVDLIIVR
jgi:DeoR/GlpR family transcriptional regulator of sugar metabolism